MNDDLKHAILNKPIKLKNPGNSRNFTTIFGIPKAAVSRFNTTSSQQSANAHKAVHSPILQQLAMYRLTVKSRNA